ncbi:MAG: hypothetical protein HPZ91_16060 [Lentisphaeria bacterium]|nr:hypothetical protein [Lentisphaeria bacterium]
MDEWMMAVPLCIDAEGRTPEYWQDMRTRLRHMGCRRVFLTVLGQGSAAPADYFRPLAEKLRRVGALFREAEIEPALWLGHTIGHSGEMSGSEARFDSIVGADPAGELRPQPGCFCPLGQPFREYLAEVLGILAESRPPLLMLDDDFRLGSHGAAFGCFCELHMARFRECTGRGISGAGLARGVRTDPELRRLWCRNNGESLYELAAVVEKAVHAVSPETRIGLASAAMLRCGDGVDLRELARIFNGGRTRPFIRTGGAPYWRRTPEHIGWAVEYSRLQREWLRGTEIEVFAEGDTYPHNTFFTAAASLEAFDEGLAASGFPGLLSYQFSYGDPRTTDPAYEALTAGRAAFHRELRLLSPPEWEEIGFEPAASPDGFLARDPELTPWGSFSEGIPALRVLPRLGIPCAFGNPAMPAVLAGEECAAFTDAELDMLLRRGAAVDAPAAEALLARGFDLGLAGLERLETVPETERYRDGATALLRTAGRNILWRAGAGEGARLLERSVFGGGIPGVLHIVTREERRVVLLPWSLERGGGLNFSFARQRQWHEAFAFLSGRPLPVRTDGRADIRLHLRRSPQAGFLAATVQNLSLDPFRLDALTVEPEYRPVSCLTAAGCRRTEGALPDFTLQPMQTAVLRFEPAGRQEHPFSSAGCPCDR